MGVVKVHKGSETSEVPKECTKCGAVKYYRPSQFKWLREPYLCKRCTGKHKFGKGNTLASKENKKI